jgi:hypothetical protein
MGVIVMSFLTMIVSLLLAIILFFEVASACALVPPSPSSLRLDAQRPTT